MFFLTLFTKKGDYKLHRTVGLQEGLDLELHLNFPFSEIWLDDCADLVARAF